MSTHGALTEHSHTYSLIAPIGKGREGKGSGKGRAAATLPVVESCKSAIKLKFSTREGI